MSKSQQLVDILLVEDSETDAELTIEALKAGRIRNRVSHVRDGEEALDYLLQRGEHKDASRPDLILLDLNMPKLDGRDVLKFMQSNASLSVIPIVVLTTSSHDKDVLESYGLAANSYIVKPVDLKQFFNVVQEVQTFWLEIVKLPPK